MKQLAADLTEFIHEYGPQLAETAADSLRPVFNPDSDELPDLSELEACRSKHSQTKFAFFPSQKEKVAGLLAGLNKAKRAWMVGEMGCGKTVMALGAAWLKCRNRKQWRVLVMCPGHLVRKWKREIDWLIPNAYTEIIENFAGIVTFHEHAKRWKGPAFAVISKETAKLGLDVDRPCAAQRTTAITVNVYTKADMRKGDTHFRKRPDVSEYQVKYRNEPAFQVTRPAVYAACPHCGEIAKNILEQEMEEPVYYENYISSDHPRKCAACGQGLWTNARGFRSNPHIDRYIQRKMKKFFTFFIADEVHELANAVTIQGNTFGTLASACRWTLALTGTVIGGKAVDLHAPMWRMSPDLLKKRAFNLHIFRESKIGPVAQNEKNFTLRYGVMEYITTRDAAENYQGYTERGATGRRKSFKTVERIRPGISPDLFNHFLMGRGVFMGLAELGPALPTIERMLFPCEPDDELEKNYEALDEEFKEALRNTCRTKGPSNVAGMRVQVLDAYLDRPWGWSPITIQAIDKDGNEYTKYIASPRNMEENRIGNKEREMLTFIQAEIKAGRRCCVYPVFTQRHNVREKLKMFLEENGVKVMLLPDSVNPLKREDWIAQNMHKMDVLIVHPRRVMTGLDLVQFPTLIWYQVGYSTHTLRQASARARRPTQKLPCKVAFFYYKDTIQQQALGLMGEKEAAAQALEGIFDTRALKAMMNGGENDDVLSALANGLEASKPPEETWRVIDAAENPTSAPRRAAPNMNTVVSPSQVTRERSTMLWELCLISPKRIERRVEQLAMFG